MADECMVSFAGLLRRLRTDAGLTQEELADAAQVSVRSVSDLERGVNQTARKETARLLADALKLEGTARAEFEAAARGHAGRRDHPGPRVLPAAAGSVASATRTLPRDVASFTGRKDELRQLVETVSANSSGGVVEICAITGMAGVGKTAFAVHVAHQLAQQFPNGQVYLPLHGHTPGQRPVEPADALASLLLTAGVAAEQIPPGQEARTRLWRDHLAGMRLLLVLDDAAGHEQVRPLLPGSAGCLVLITSRRHLTALEDTHTISLDTLPPDEASELLIRLAGRSDMDPGNESVGEITMLCGYLPLAVGMLARQLHYHPAWSCTRLAADLAAARDRLAFMHAENLSVAAAFDLSYVDLTPDQRRLFRRLGLHPGTEIDAYAAAALDRADITVTRHLLEALYDQQLLTEPAHGRYRMHDLIREHARALAADDPVAETERAIRSLLDYYLHTAVAASRHLVRRSPVQPPTATGIAPASAPDLSRHEDAVKWFAAERLNVHAAVSYAAENDRRGFAVPVAAAMHGFLRSHGHWDQALLLDRMAIGEARAEGDYLAEAGALINLGEIQQLTGDYSAAAASLGQALELYDGLGERLGKASALNELGVVKLAINDHAGSVDSHERALRIYRDLGHQAGEASALNELGLVQRAIGDYRAATASHRHALRLYRDLGNRIGEASALNRLAQMQRSMGNYSEATESHEQALALHRDLGNKIGEATALYGLGIVRQAAGDLTAAVASQEEALRLYRGLRYRFGEATALLGLGAAQLDAGETQAARASFDQALQLHTSLRNRIGEAAALNGLGTACWAARDYPEAGARIEQSLRICRDTRHRPGEADALAALGAVHLAAGNLDSARSSLSQALALYRDLGVRNGEAETLNTLGESLLAASDPAGAEVHHRDALAIATAIALRSEQARALEGIGRCQLQDGQAGEGIAALRQALAIYQDIGSGGAKRIEAVLGEHATGT